MAHAIDRDPLSGAISIHLASTPTPDTAPTLCAELLPLLTEEHVLCFYDASEGGLPPPDFACLVAYVRLLLAHGNTLARHARGLVVCARRMDAAAHAAAKTLLALWRPPFAFAVVVGADDASAAMQRMRQDGEPFTSVAPVG